MNRSTTTIMVLGGYGNFGARICRALAGDPTIRLLVTGRSASKAQRMATQVGGTAQGLALDHNTVDLSNILRGHGVDLVIHTAGPFQHQGYGVALACAQAGAHYIDLADGRRFVCDFPQALNSAFVAAGRSGICGASTVPALSSAVVEHLCEGWQRIDSIDICIAPAQRAPRGQATLAGVLSYCGKEIAVWQGARWQQRLGWASPEPVHFHRLRSRVGALCDIPDLELFPSHYRVRQRVWFAAALEVSLAQWSFAAIAALRARGLLRQPERLAGLLHRTGGVLDFLGTPLGGMVVHVRGIDGSGMLRHRSWHIAADDDHGPEIPCMAAIVLARQLAQGKSLPIGAHTSMGLVPLEAFAPEFAKWAMLTDIIEGSAS